MKLQKEEHCTNYYANKFYGSCVSEVGDENHDPRFIKIGEIKEDMLFEDNGVMNAIQKLPDYPVTESYNFIWNLYANRYYTWRDE